MPGLRHIGGRRTASRSNCAAEPAVQAIANMTSSCACTGGCAVDTLPDPMTGLDPTQAQADLSGDPGSGRSASLRPAASRPFRSPEPSVCLLSGHSLWAICIAGRETEALGTKGDIFRSQPRRLPITRINRRRARQNATSLVQTPLIGEGRRERRMVVVVIRPQAANLAQGLRGINEVPGKELD